MSSSDQVFQAAVDSGKRLRETGHVPTDKLLRLYAFYKQAIEGNNETTSPTK